MLKPPETTYVSSLSFVTGELGRKFAHFPPNELRVLKRLPELLFCLKTTVTNCMQQDERYRGLRFDPVSAMTSPEQWELAVEACRESYHAGQIPEDKCRAIDELYGTFCRPNISAEQQHQVAEIFRHVPSPPRASWAKVPRPASLAGRRISAFGV